MNVLKEGIKTKEGNRVAKREGSAEEVNVASNVIYRLNFIIWRVICFFS